MSQEQKEAVGQLLREAPVDFAGDLAEQRVVLEQIMTAHPLADGVVTVSDVVGGVPVVRIEVTGLESESVIVYFHGAYTMGSAAAAAGLASELARRARSRAASVEYRLAPEYPYPASLEDALAAYRGVLDSGIRASDVVVAAESAGGGLAIALLATLADHRLPPPPCTVVFSPWVDLTLSGSSVDEKAAVDPALTAAGLRRRAAEYVADANPPTA
jgi:monoterpene epsilon-lactone hydrolase